MLVSAFACPVRLDGKKRRPSSLDSAPVAPISGSSPRMADGGSSRGVASPAQRSGSWICDLGRYRAVSFEETTGPVEDRAA